MSSKDIAKFEPSPGYILVELLEETNTFKPSETKPDDTAALIGKVLKVGPGYLNEVNTTFYAPVAEGDEILFRYEYNQDELEVDFKKYPVIHFKQVRGIL